MKIYTGTGDAGITSLANGQRIGKDDPHLHTYGSVDELNVLVGLLQNTIQDTTIKEQLVTIQNMLFNVGAFISHASGQWITENDTKKIETWIDAMQTYLPPIKNFILPNGTQTSLYAHLCRTQTRLVERLYVKLFVTNKNPITDTLNDTPQINTILILLNRLSDYFFVLARYVNYKEGGKELLWNTPPIKQ